MYLVGNYSIHQTIVISIHKHLITVEIFFHSDFHAWQTIAVFDQQLGFQSNSVNEYLISFGIFSHSEFNEPLILTILEA